MKYKKRRCNKCGKRMYEMYDTEKDRIEKVCDDCRRKWVNKNLWCRRCKKEKIDMAHFMYVNGLCENCMNEDVR